MHLGKHLTKIPYRFTWQISRLFHKGMQIDFLCGNIAIFIAFKGETMIKTLDKF